MALAVGGFTAVPGLAMPGSCELAFVPAAAFAETVADTLDFAFTQADALDLTFTQADALDFPDTVADLLNVGS